jgi:carboxymethylenebutenolidase
VSDLILIQPTRTMLTATRDDVHVLEIRLGGAPRGLVVLVIGPDTPEIDVVEAMNHLAGDGFESIAAAVGPGGLADALLARAADRGWEPEQTGVVGIGAGGDLALELARTRLLGAVVSLSPTPDLADVAARPVLRTPWLGLFGEHAGDLTRREVGALGLALEAGSDVFSQVVVYPGVGSDFHRRSEDGISFAASYDGWQRVAEWLLARVAARPTPLALAWRERTTG